MHDRAAFKGNRALVARIPAHTSPAAALHSLAPYGCPATTASLSGPSCAQPRALRSCSGPCQAGAADQACSFASQAPSHRRRAHCLWTMGPRWGFSDENPTEAAEFFLWRAFPLDGPPISVHICPYLSISVYICPYLSIYLSISVYICLYLSISEHELATVGRAILIL